MLISYILFYNKSRKELEITGFKFNPYNNPYNPCVANNTTDGFVLTGTIHVDDVKSGHVNPRANDDSIHSLVWKYRYP